MLREFLKPTVANMSYILQQLHNWLISLLLIWFNMVFQAVRFLGHKCFVHPLLLSDYSINHCFHNMLEGVGLKKLNMLINPKNLNWMVFVMRIFQLLAESWRNKHKCAWPNYLSTLIGSLISQNSLWSYVLGSCSDWSEIVVMLGSCSNLFAIALFRYCKLVVL